MYICVCVCVYTYMFTYVHTHTHTHTYTNRYLYIRTSSAETRGLTRTINFNETFRDTNPGIKKDHILSKQSLLLQNNN